MTTGVTSLRLKIAFYSAIRLVAIMVFLIVGQNSNCLGESLTGVRMSDHSGFDKTATGDIRLLVDNKVHRLGYGEPVPRRFKSQICNDLGVSWSVLFRRLKNGSTDIISVTCLGEVDEGAHAPWLVVRDFLNRVGVDRSTLSSSLFSQRWRSSPETVRVRSKLASIDAAHFRQLGRSGTCLDIVRKESVNRTEVEAGADCYLRIENSPVDVIFTVTRNPTSQSWEIDELRIEPPTVSNERLMERERTELH